MRTILGSLIAAAVFATAAGTLGAPAKDPSPVGVEVSNTSPKRGQLFKVKVTAPPTTRCQLTLHYQHKEARRVPLYGSVSVKPEGFVEFPARVPFDVKDGSALAVAHCRADYGERGVPPGMGYAEFAIGKR